MRPTAIDLFSGAGGLTLGLKRAGFSVRGAVELDELAAETYRLNHPKTRMWRADVRHVEPLEVSKELGIEPGDLGLLAGCPPCQGFSSVRTLNGSRAVSDDRNDLVSEFGRFALALRPRLVMLENVPGLARDSRLEALRDELAAAGFHTEWRLVDAADYGVPQRRLRFMLLGSRDGRVSFARPHRARRTVRETIGKLPPAGSSGDPLHDHGEHRSDAVKLRISLIPKDGGSRRDLPESAQLDCHRKSDGFGDVYGRMAWDSVAPTVTGGCINPSKGRFVHPDLDRAITLREASLLQGFPSSYRLSLRRGKFAAATMIGNALPPGLVATHARALLRSNSG